MNRYSRQIDLPEIGQEGQEKLAKARVLIVGVGGLGSPISLYLAAAGVGTLGLIDHDVVSLSNLQRQVLYSEENIGLSKAEQAANRLRALNSEIQIVAYSTKLTKKNAKEIIEGFDIVVDGCDNYTTRYLISDTCKLLDKYYVYGSIQGFEGHVALFSGKRDTLSYRDLFPEQPDEPSTTDRNKRAVIGVTPAIVGSVEANEVLKLIVGYGENLLGRLWTIDLRTLQSQIIQL